MAIAEEIGYDATGKETGNNELDLIAEELKKFGRALFMYMYNDLPGGKQIEKVKKLVDDPYWVNEYHYINMNHYLKIGHT